MVYNWLCYYCVTEVEIKVHACILNPKSTYVHMCHGIFVIVFSGSLSGVILDAPYTTIREAAYHHPFGIPYWPFMSLFMEDFVFGQLKEKFPVIDYVKNVHCPIVIFHGEKDMIIPYHLGYNVFLNAQKYGRSSNVSFHSCGSTTHKKNYLSQTFHSALDGIAQLCEP